MNKTDEYARVMRKFMRKFDPLACAAVMNVISAALFLFAAWWRS